MSIIYDCIRTWHVAKTGNDSNGGHSFTDAKLTIGATITAASAGDTIVIWPGTYTGSFTVNKSLKFVGASRQSCIITYSSGVCVSLSGGSGSSFENLSIINTATGQFDYAVAFSGSSHIKFTNCYIKGANSADTFDVCSGGDAYIKDCYIVNLAGTAASMTTPYDTVEGEGIRFENTTFVAHGAGISTSGNRVFMKNCLIFVNATSDNTVYGIYNNGAMLNASDLQIRVFNSSTGGNTTLGVYCVSGSVLLKDSVVYVVDSGASATLVAAIQNDAKMVLNNINWSVETSGAGTTLTTGLQLSNGSVTTADNIQNYVSGKGVDVAGVKNNGGRATLSNMNISVAQVEAIDGIVAGIYSANSAAYTVLNESAVYITGVSGGKTVYGLYSAAGKCVFVGVSFDCLQATSGSSAPLNSSCTAQSTGFEKTQFIDGHTSYPGLMSNDFYNNWTLVWTSGANTGESKKVLDWVTSNNEFFFSTGFTNDIQVGDAYTLTKFTYQDIYTAAACIVNLSCCNYDPTKVSGSGTVKDYLRPATLGATLDVSAAGKAAKVILNKAVQNKETGAIKFYDDDGETVILTHTPDDGESEITRTPN